MLCLGSVGGGDANGTGVAASMSVGLSPRQRIETAVGDLDVVAFGVMPSALHEALIEIFRKRDRLAVELLVRAFGAEVPGFDGVRVGNSDRSQTRPPEA